MRDNRHELQELQQERFRLAIRKAQSHDSHQLED